MKILNPKTVDYLDMLNKSLGGSDYEAINADFKELVLRNRFLAPVDANFLEPLMTVDVPKSNGVWNWQENQNLIVSELNLNVVKKLCCIKEHDEPTTSVLAEFFHIKKKGIYKEFIPDEETVFFEHLAQAFGIFKKNRELLEMVSHEKTTLMIPFAKDFVANIFYSVSYSDVAWKPHLLDDPTLWLPTEKRHRIFILRQPPH